MIVRDILAVMFEDEKVEIVSEFNKHKCGGSFRAGDHDLDDSVLNADVLKIWRSVFDRIMIVIE
jgi:hypothetical protein